jgi:hypothetical protein
MKKYTIQVCMTYVHIVDVEAENDFMAEQKAFDAFDLDKSMRGEGECWIVEVNGEAA